MIFNPLKITPREDRDYVRGGSTYITPTINVQAANWVDYLPTFEPQKFKYDTDECSQLSGINIVATQCNFLIKQGKFSKEAIQWFSDNGYFDANGSFAFSERFTAILSGTTINGNNPWNFWKTISKIGLLPRKDFNYTLEQSASFSSQTDQDNDYYNSASITQAMRDKALKSLNWLQIQYEWVGDGIVTPSDATLSVALQQAPLQIGVPIPATVSFWNYNYVKYDGSRQLAHCVSLYGIDTDGSYLIYDQYHPENKKLSPDYYIPQVVLGYIQPTVGMLPKAPILTSVLSIGAFGAQVSILQDFLIKGGYARFQAPSGFFGVKTFFAVQAYQAAHGISATGFVGPITLASING